MYMKNIDKGSELLSVSHVFDLSMYFSLIRRHLKLYKHHMHQGITRDPEQQGDENSYSDSDTESDSVSEDEQY